jgi:transposase
MVEIKEVLRRWLTGGKKAEIAKAVGVDRKTVRRYIHVGELHGLKSGQVPDEVLTEETLVRIGEALRPVVKREHGGAYELCVREREFIGKKLADKVRLSKVQKLLVRKGVRVPYSTLRRFAADEFDFGKPASSVPVADGEPGEMVQVDTGWMTLLEPNESGKRRRFRAWIFTPVLSRYRFVWPCFPETTESAIEACEEAWRFYGGVFRVVIPDNTKAIVAKADPLGAKIVVAMLEYAQARGFVIDPTRRRRPKDKARVERAVRDVRDDCYGGESLRDIDGARVRALVWSTDEYGMRRHTTTQRMPREHFESVEKSCLLPVPDRPYDVPQWVEPKVGPDQIAQVMKAIYSLPRYLRGQRLDARADRDLVKFYFRGKLVKTHTRQPPGGKAIDPADYPEEEFRCAQRDTAFMVRKAAEHGVSVASFARALVDTLPPWTRIRCIYALLGLVRRYGAARVDEACAMALAADMTDIHRLERMLKLATPAPKVESPSSPALARVIPLGRYLRPTAEYALPCVREAITDGEEDEE